MIEPKIVFQVKKDSSKLTEEKIKKMNSFLSSANKPEENILNTKSSAAIKIINPVSTSVETTPMEEINLEIAAPLVMSTEEVSPPSTEQELIDVINELVPDSPAAPKKKSTRKKKSAHTE